MPAVFYFSVTNVKKSQFILEVIHKEEECKKQQKKIIADEYCILKRDSLRNLTSNKLLYDNVNFYFIPGAGAYLQLQAKKQRVKTKKEVILLRRGNRILKSSSLIVSYDTEEYNGKKDRNIIIFNERSTKGKAFIEFC
ncbi:hypothetical protein C1646_747548 [Rhizophagus diaphanus]|nr:hypothetical protein C1646_747548 [Rhizophagus diaphanus] [Rhizophagus sp. MUCL 43196]